MKLKFRTIERLCSTHLQCVLSIVSSTAIHSVKKLPRIEIKLKKVNKQKGKKNALDKQVIKMN